MQYCTSCGTKIEAGNRFCTNCSSKIEQSTREATDGRPNRQTVPNHSSVDPAKWKATAGLILGILSILFCRVTSLGILLGLLGIVFGAMGRKSTSNRQQAVWGLGLSIAGLLISLITWIFLTSLALFFGGGVFGNWLNQ